MLDGAEPVEHGAAQRRDAVVEEDNDLFGHPDLWAYGRCVGQ
ncbi:hypothetical protein ACFQYP_17095 [Nonomuraea antimicrobica]